MNTFIRDNCADIPLIVLVCNALNLGHNRVRPVKIDQSFKVDAETVSHSSALANVVWGDQSTCILQWLFPTG